MLLCTPTEKFFQTDYSELIFVTYIYKSYIHKSPDKSQLPLKLQITDMQWLLYPTL